jgi:hypothetical protein
MFQCVPKYKFKKQAMTEYRNTNTSEQNSMTPLPHSTLTDNVIYF